MAEARAFAPPSEFPTHPQATSGYSPPFASLPLDIYYSISSYLDLSGITALISLTRAVRALLLPHLDAFVSRYMAVHEAYYLPVSAQCPRGDEEQIWWAAQWELSDGKGQYMKTHVRWFAYARACGKSRSMRNRRRIWGIVDKIESLARERGLFPC